MVCSIILLLFYTCTLIWVCVGSQYSSVNRLIYLLMLSNVGTLVNIYGSNKLFDTDTPSLASILMLSIGWSVQDLCFSTAHWIFAVRYYKTSTNMPFIIKGEAVPEDLEIK